MDAFKTLIDSMNRYLNTADHLVYVTYPLVKEEKLILAALENLHNALIFAVEAILFYDKMYKRIGLYPDNFNAKLETFKLKCAPRYNFERGTVVLIQDVYELIQQHEKSQMEFARKDKYYIFDRDYVKMKAIDLPRIKAYIMDAKPFIEKVNRIYQHDLSRRTS